jgi:hypothetical protein
MWHQWLTAKQRMKVLEGRLSHACVIYDESALRHQAVDPVSCRHCR